MKKVFKRIMRLVEFFEACAGLVLFFLLTLFFHGVEIDKPNNNFDEE